MNEMRLMPNPNAIVFEENTQVKKRHTFVLPARPGSIVSVAGCFNDWNPNSHILKDRNGNGEYRCTVLLPPGIYRYKFRVNNSWRIDPANQYAAPDFDGTLSSVVEIG